MSQSCARLARAARWQGDLDTAEKICRRGIALVTQLCDTPEDRPGATNAMKYELQECEQTRVLNGPLDALLKRPATEVSLLLFRRVDLFASRRDISEVAQTADALARFEPKSGWSLFAAARGYAVCAKLASGWPGSGPFPPKETATKSAREAKPHSDTDRKKYARAAIEMLQAAVKSGFKNARSALLDPHFAAVSGDPEFKKLTAELPKPNEPRGFRFGKAASPAGQGRLRARGEK